MDRLLQLALLFGRRAGDPARHDFSLFGHELLEQLMILEIDVNNAFQVSAPFLFREKAEPAVPVPVAPGFQ